MTQYHDDDGRVAERPMQNEKSNHERNKTPRPEIIRVSSNAGPNQEGIKANTNRLRDHDLNEPENKNSVR